MNRELGNAETLTLRGLPLSIEQGAAYVQAGELRFGCTVEESYWVEGERIVRLAFGKQLDWNEAEGTAVLVQGSRAAPLRSTGSDFREVDWAQLRLQLEARCARWKPDRDLRDELVSESFRKLLAWNARQPQLALDGHEGHLRRGQHILDGVWIDHVRSSKRRTCLSIQDETEENESGMDVPDEAHGPAEIAAGREEHDRLRDTLESLLAEGWSEYAGPQGELKRLYDRELLLRWSEDPAQSIRAIGRALKESFQESHPQLAQKHETHACKRLAMVLQRLRFHFGNGESLA